MNAQGIGVCRLTAPILTFGWVLLLAADLNFGLLTAS
jgi:hypothetical protein